jgi:sirohydrochlorin cobaltochelatase
VNVAGTGLDDVVDARLRILLPPEFHESYPLLQARPMGSAGLVFDAEGRVAWDEIWQTFCDLALAGGPPHKGKLLEPGTPQDIEARPGDQLSVLEELDRGITMASELPVAESPHLGWIRVQCHSAVMAQWMLRAITTENVAVRQGDVRSIDLPAAPAFRIDKEIKNVITVVAKTCHYWMGHIPREQKIEIGRLFEELNRVSPLVEPAWPEGGRPGWRPVPCASIAEALHRMRTLIATNVLARREETVLFVPEVLPVAHPGPEPSSSLSK